MCSDASAAAADGIFTFLQVYLVPASFELSMLLAGFQSCTVLLALSCDTGSRVCFWRQFYSELAVTVVKWSGDTLNLMTVLVRVEMIS